MAIERQVLHEVPIQQLKPNPDNPRLNEPAVPEVIKSIQQSDYISPIIVDEDDIILAGNTRYKAMLALKRDVIPLVVRVTGLTADQKRRFVLADNKTQEFAEWDWEKLSVFGEEMLASVGFTDAELDKILRGEDSYKVPVDVRDNFAVQSGDVFQVGEHRIVCGDSRDEFAYLQLFDGSQGPASMIWTDPPYNVNFQGGMSATGQHGRDPIAHDNMSEEDFFQFLKDCMRNMMKNCSGIFYVCMSGKELPSLKRAFEEEGGHWQTFIVWVKNTFTLSRSDWQSMYEPILYGWNGKNKDHYYAGWRDEPNVWRDLEEILPEYKDGKTLIKIGEHHIEIEGEVKGRIINMKEKTDIWFEKKPSKSQYHPTEKPIKLVRKAIEASSRRGDIVLDPFLGGGSALLACMDSHRVCYGIELEPKFVDVCLRRAVLAQPDITILRNGQPYDKELLK